MTDLESRLRDQLVGASEQLPAADIPIDTVIERGRQRRTRARLVTGLCGVVVAMVAAGAVVVVLPQLQADRNGIVVADRPDQPTGQGEPADVAGNEPAGDQTSPASSRRPPTTATATTTSTVTAPASTSTAPVPERDGTDSDSSVSPSSSTTGDPEAGRPGVTPSAAAIAQLPADAVRFHSDHEGCAELADPRAHPDWIEGQPGDGRNDDGTPTYGFAFNSGRVTAGDLDWRFGPQPAGQPPAPSGECVLAMTIDGADDGGNAIRLFRRYDRSGQPLPEDGYYSVWLYFGEDIVYDNQATIDGETVFGFWNIFQIKNEVRLDRSDDTASLSALSFNAGRLPDEPAMGLFAFRKAVCGAVEDCDEADSFDQVDPVPLPIGRWVHLELRLVSRPDDRGRVTVWQDGQQILDVAGVTERPNTERITWSLNHMGRLHRTASHTLWADDPLISTEPIHPHLFD